MHCNTFTENILEKITNRELEKIKILLAEAEEVEILHVFHNVSAEEQVITFRLLTKEKALMIFEQLDTDLQHNLLRSFTEESVIEYMNELAPDDRVRLLDEMPAAVAKKLLSSLSPEERCITNILMGYEEETAGRIMTTEFISLRKEMTVAQAMEKIRRQAADMETIYTLYVTDNTKKLEGVLSLKELVCAEPDDIVEDIMHFRAINVSTDTDQEEVARLLQELDLLAIPVVDKENRIIGIVTIDDAMDILQDETTDDIFDHVGLVDVAGTECDRSELLVSGSVWKIWKVRLPFLVITMLAGFLAAGIIQGFEDALSISAAVAFFIPLIMDMGGNVGTQSSTVFARGVVLGHISMNRFFRHLAKEAGIGLSMGLLAGVAGGLLAGVWHYPTLGLAVGVSLVVTMTLAATLGFLVPFVLLKLNADQAAGSAPIITSIKDIVGLFIYFAMVMLLMGHML